ncbi:MAG: phosphatidate cytidylyltransferase [Gammaproteobacteria bacterium]|jgi:phosphatidate cytidylyltransferase|nr:phosphatidate cytidylyltransferase [Gammaproteobacteria bacterium]
MAEPAASVAGAGLSTLTKRVLTALVLAAAAGAALFWVPAPGAVVFFSAVLLIGLWEWSGFLTPPRVVRRIALCASALLFAAYLNFVYTDAVAVRPYLIGAVVWWTGLGVWLTQSNKTIGPVFIVLSAWFCLVPAWVSLRVLLDAGAGALLLLWLVSLVAAADIGAYFTGRRWGRHKLAPRLSPGKTIEGAVGGLLCAAAVGGAGALLLEQPPLVFILVAPLIAAVSVVGDLTVSAFKRHAGLKDTGWILPGHGGVMDRVDSLVAAAPLFVMTLSLAGILP